MNTKIDRMLEHILTNMESCRHKHKTCVWLYSQNAHKSAFCLPLRQNADSLKWEGLLGFQKSGPYENSSNLIGGKMEPSDNGCYVRCAIREAWEEAGFRISINEFFEKFSDHKRKKLRVIISKGTPIFFGNFEKYDIQQLNIVLTNRSLDQSLPDYMKEMSTVKWFNLSFVCTHNSTISRFSQQVFKDLLCKKWVLTGLIVEHVVEASPSLLEQ